MKSLTNLHIFRKTYKSNTEPNKTYRHNIILLRKMIYTVVFPRQLGTLQPSFDSEIIRSFCTINYNFDVTEIHNNLRLDY